MQPCTQFVLETAYASPSCYIVSRSCFEVVLQVRLSEPCMVQFGATGAKSVSCTCCAVIRHSETYLSNHLEKENSARCSNWEARPLSMQQTAYAAADVHTRRCASTRYAQVSLQRDQSWVMQTFTFLVTFTFLARCARRTGYCARLCAGECGGYWTRRFSVRTREETQLDLNNHQFFAFAL